jgi:hypothetical protein
MKYPADTEASVAITFSEAPAPVLKQPRSNGSSFSSGKSGRLSHDTVAGCRENARLDTAQADKMDTSNARSKYELSAASWTARGDMLERFEESRVARLMANIQA